MTDFYSWVKSDSMIAQCGGAPLVVAAYNEKCSSDEEKLYCGNWVIR